MRGRGRRAGMEESRRGENKIENRNSEREDGKADTDIKKKE
jgi:hypothetical protein